MTGSAIFRYNNSAHKFSTNNIESFYMSDANEILLFVLLVSLFFFFVGTLFVMHKYYK